MGMELLSGLGLGVGMGTAYSGLTDILRTGITWTKWKALGATQGYAIIADTLQKIIGAEKDEVHGLSTKGMVDAIHGFIDRTLDFSWLINEQIASQLFVQMIQQSIAYAIHSSHAGSIGTVCNVYSGSASLSPLSLSGIGENVDLADRGVKGFLSAAVGLNVPSTAFTLLQGTNRRIEDVYRKIMNQIDSLTDEWNDLALGYYRHYHTMSQNRFQDALEMREAIVNRAYGFLEQVANDHLARINEQLDTLEGAKAWFDGGLLNADELKEFAIRIGIEVDASEVNFDDYLKEILGNIDVSLAEWDDKITIALQDMQDCEYRYSLVIKTIFESLFTDVREFVNIICDEIDKTIEDVCAYRNVQQAVKIESVNDLGEVEGSPEIDITRLRYQKWREIEDITHIDEYDEPRGMKWHEADEFEVEIERTEIAVVVPRKRFVEVETDTVIHESESTPLTPWVDVE